MCSSGQIKSYYLPALVEQLREVNEQVRQTNAKYRKEMLERKRLHNMVQELKGNIRVFMRCRSGLRSFFVASCFVNIKILCNAGLPLRRRSNSSDRTPCA